jgi:hypothetical protein
MENQGRTRRYQVHENFNFKYASHRPPALHCGEDGQLATGVDRADLDHCTHDETLVKLGLP